MQNMKLEDNIVIIENYLKEKNLVFEKVAKGDKVVFSRNIKGLLGAEVASR